MSSTEWLLVVGGVAVGLYLAFVAVLLVAGRHDTARAFAGFIPDCIVLLRRLLGDQRVPRRMKFVLAAAVGYLALPFDLVPDFIPVAGQLDDAIVVGLALRAVVRDAGPEVVREHWPGPPNSLALVLRVASRRDG